MACGLRTRFFISLLVAFAPWGARAKTVRYELEIRNEKLNLSGKKTVNFALTVNGGIPAPTLEFTEGDDAEIVVKNRIPHQEASIHWHGILLPPEMDGVPYVSGPPIPSGGEFKFRFRIRQHGTYWYHSHTMTQEQEGVYGALVIHPKTQTIRYDKDVVVVLSDWADESGERILGHLKKDGDYYLYKKGTMRSWLGAARAGRLGVYLGNEWARMGGMDFSDVGYDAFLMNAKRDSQLVVAHPGEKICLRLINAAASSYFNVSLGQTPMKVISADGVDVEPISTREILMGMAETYDVLFEVPEYKNFELRATAQDGTGSVSGWIGMGERVAAPQKAVPDLYAPMHHGGHGAPAGHDVHGAAPSGEHSHEGHDMSAMDHSMHENHESHTGHGGHAHVGASETEPTLFVETLTVDDLKSPHSTSFPKGAQTYELRLVLGGDMRRYVWYLNDKAIYEDRTISIREGDIVRFTFENSTMMHHPMHLHGHFFRVVNKNGERSPLKHTVDVPPHGSRTIEFRADEPGEWMLHCHNLFHMNTGMARVVKYSSFVPRPEVAHLQHLDHHLHDPWYFYGSAELATNHGQASFRLSQTWNEWSGRVESRNTSGRNLAFDEPWETEVDLLYRRWMSPYLHAIAGGLLFDQKVSAALGVGYTLPMLVESQVLVDHRGKFRVALEKRFQWAQVIFTDVDFAWRPARAHRLAQEIEYEVSLMYSPAWSWAAGLMLTERNLGAGVQARF